MHILHDFHFFVSHFLLLKKGIFVHFMGDIFLLDYRWDAFCGLFNLTIACLDRVHLGSKSKMYSIDFPPISSHLWTSLKLFYILHQSGVWKQKKHTWHKFIFFIIVIVIYTIVWEIKPVQSALISPYMMESVGIW